MFIQTKHRLFQGKLKNLINIKNLFFNFKSKTSSVNESDFFFFVYETEKYYPLFY